MKHRRTTVKMSKVKMCFWIKFIVVSAHWDRKRRSADRGKWPILLAWKTFSSSSRWWRRWLRALRASTVFSALHTSFTLECFSRFYVNMFVKFQRGFHWITELKLWNKYWEKRNLKKRVAPTYGVRRRGFTLMNSSLNNWLFQELGSLESAINGLLNFLGWHLISTRTKFSLCLWNSNVTNNVKDHFIV